MDFLPTNYETPATNSNYMKLQDGENKLRIISKPVIGWLDWKDNHPQRFRMDAKPKAPNDPKKPIRHFWAMIVWNYNANAVQILEVTQSTIQKAIETLAKDEDWGAPFSYDIKINRKGKDKETEYNVNPSPKKSVSQEVYKAALDKPINLECLFDGCDPFAPNEKQTEIEITEF